MVQREEVGPWAPQQEQRQRRVLGQGLKTAQRPKHVAEGQKLQNLAQTHATDIIYTRKERARAVNK